MKPGLIVILPKPDRRYKPGSIKKDKNGIYRGHPDTVRPTPLFSISEDMPTLRSLNPPIIVSKELAAHIKGAL